MHRMIGKVYKSKKVWDIVRHGEEIKVVIATSEVIFMPWGQGINMTGLVRTMKTTEPIISEIYSFW